MVSFKHRLPAILTILTGLTGCSPMNPPSGVLPYPDAEKYTEQAAKRMIRSSRETLAPVYAPLAEHIADRFRLADREGTGIDLGGGPGTLILELAVRTQLHWINADINPYFFPYFYQEAARRSLGGRVSAVFADAQSLPFRDNLADIITSRGSLHFWDDQTAAFREIYRVLKPGGVAFIGRGFPETLPLETARAIRAKQKNLNYDPAQTAEQLRQIMRFLGIHGYTIYRPQVDPERKIHYGVWIEIHKPL